VAEPPPGRLDKSTQSQPNIQTGKHELLALVFPRCPMTDLFPDPHGIGYAAYPRPLKQRPPKVPFFQDGEDAGEAKENSNV
jgi:hypothetical protein